MARLLNNEVLIAQSGGDFRVITTMAAGTSKLQISQDSGSTYTDITDASWNATTTAILRVSKGDYIKAVLTGDATMYLKFASL